MKTKAFRIMILMVSICFITLAGCAKKPDQTTGTDTSAAKTEIDDSSVKAADTAKAAADKVAADATEASDPAASDTAAADANAAAGTTTTEFIPASEKATLKERPEEGDLKKASTFYAQVPKNRYGGMTEEGDYAVGEFILWLNEVLLSDSGEILQRGKYAVPYIVSNNGNEENLCMLSGGNDGERPYGDDIWEITTDEKGDIVDAVLYSQTAALKRNQEAGYFIEHDGKIYYRLPGAEAMQASALFGSFMSGYNGPSEIRCYDPATGKSEKFYDSNGYGKMYVLEDNLVALEKGSTDGSGRDNLAMIPFDGSEATTVEGLNFQIMAIYDHYIIYESDDYDKSEYTVNCIDIDNESTIELGKLETFEDNPYPGELQQFYADGSDIWFTMADYEGTGHFYYTAKLYHADRSREESLTARSIADIDDLPGITVPDDIAGTYNRAPAFVIRDNTPYLTTGEPATTEIDYGSGELAYYDNDGCRTPVRGGFETFESEEEGTTVTIELTEYTGDKIFLIRNESWRDTAGDVGWREAYVRKYTYIVMVDPKTGEETIIDAAYQRDGYIDTY